MNAWIEDLKAMRQNACNNQEVCILCYLLKSNGYTIHLNPNGVVALIFSSLNCIFRFNTKTERD